MAFARPATSPGRLFVGLYLLTLAPHCPKNPSKRTNHAAGNCVTEVIEAPSTPTSSVSPYPLMHLACNRFIHHFDTSPKLVTRTENNNLLSSITAVLHRHSVRQCHARTDPTDMATIPPISGQDMNNTYSDYEGPVPVNGKFFQPPTKPWL